MPVIAQQHPDLFIDMVAVLDEEFWEDFFYRNGDQPEWLQQRWEEASWQVRFHAQGSSPCWCGSGGAYWHCCAERDDVFAEEFAAEEQEREWLLDPESSPWWHPDSGVDHFTSSAYVMFYADSDQPVRDDAARVAGFLARKRKRRQIQPAERAAMSGKAVASPQVFLARIGR